MLLYATIMILLSFFDSSICQHRWGNIVISIKNYEYEKAIKILIDNQYNCRDSCDFIRYFNWMISLSSADNFKKLSEEDIKSEMQCNFGYYLPFGPIFYYYRAGNKEELSKFKESILRQTLGEYIFFNSFKNMSCEEFLNLYKSYSEVFFGSPSAAYLMYKCGEVEKAKEIAYVRYDHFKKEIKKKGLFYEGSPRMVLEHYIYSIIFNLNLKESEKKKLEKAKEFFPYLFELYK